MSEIKNGGAPTAYASDVYGNLTAKAEDDLSTTSYAYDLADKLTTIDRSGTASDAAFTFDALGRFKTRVIGAAASTDTYSYVGPTETVSRIVTTGTGAGTVDSIPDAIGNRLGVDTGATMNWFLADLHGNTAGALNAAETSVVNAIRYDPWGEITASGSEAAGKVAEGLWTYQGRLDVSPSGVEPLYDMSARF